MPEHTPRRFPPDTMPQRFLTKLAQEHAPYLEPGGEAKLLRDGGRGLIAIGIIMSGLDLIDEHHVEPKHAIALAIGGICIAAGNYIARQRNGEAVEMPVELDGSQIKKT